MLSLGAIDPSFERRRAHPLKDYGNFDSKFRFVIVASKRAKELLKGAKPRIKAKSKNPIRIAQNEVRMGLVDYDIVRAKREESPPEEQRVLLPDEVSAEAEIEEEERKKDELTREEEEEEGEEEEIEIDEEEVEEATEESDEEEDRD